MAENTKIEIDPDELTIGDLEELERIAGEPAGKVFTRDFSAGTLKALVYVWAAKTNPDFTLEDAALVRFGDIDIKGDADVPPTVATD